MTDKVVAVGGGDFDVTQVFDLLESSNVELVQEIKAEISETFNKTRDSWLVTGLFEFYLFTGSTRCGEILCGISKEPHDKFLIDKIAEGIRSPSKDIRKQSLIFFGQVVSKQPSWLYKVTQQSLFKELIRLLKTETDVVVLLTGVLSICMIIPTLPTYVYPYIPDVFDVFGRLATWAQMSQNLPKEHVLHLQVGLYSLFHRLYAMYPCNFLSYLRHNFSSSERRIVFYHTIMPMLEKVKMHPALVTATKEGELHPQRWRSKEYHEMIAECSKISLDVYESSFPEEITPTFSRLSSLDIEGDPSKGSNVAAFGEWTIESLLKLPASTVISQAMQTSDLTSLVSYLDDCNTAPPTPLSVGATSLTMGPPPSPMIINKTASPPETAVEATPENTPIKERLHFKLPPTSPAALQLNFANIDHIKEKYSKPYAPATTPTPFNSVPSSPLPVLSSNSNVTEFPLPSTGPGHPPLVRRDSIFDSATVSAAPLRRDSLIFQRLQKVQLEQLQQSQQLTGPPPVEGQASESTNSTTTASAVPVVSSTSVLKSSIPESASTNTITTSTFPHRKSSIPAPISIPSSQNFLQHDDQSSSGNSADFLNDRDRPTGGPLTPMLPSSGQSQSILDPDLSLITLDEESVVDDCKTMGCHKGGLHMADHKQMIAFAKRVSRLRFHSQCVTGSGVSDLTGSGVGFVPSPGTSPSSTSSGLQNFKIRIIKRSFSLPNIQKPVIPEDDESNLDSSNEMVVSLAEPSDTPTPTPDNQTSGDVNQQESILQVEAAQLPYDHLFQQILPTVLSPPVNSRTLPSPHFLLDLCIIKAASLHNAKAKMDEISMLRGQVALLHGQLLFERHRREAHALRNRRLAGKCREMQTMEEQNNSMRLENHNLEKEVVMLKQEVMTQRSMALGREKDLDIKILDLERKLETYRLQLSDLKDEKSQMEIKYNRLQEEYLTLQKESDKKKADLFSRENEIQHLQKYLNLNNELKSAYDTSQKEILLLGELLRCHQETTYHHPPDSRRYFKEEMDDMRQTCEEEIRVFKNALESKMSQCEAFCGMIQDLEKKLEKREAIIMEQKQSLQEAAREQTEKLTEYQAKYESVKSDNHKLELEIINLQDQLTRKTYSTRSTTRGRITSSPSNGEMSGNSNHSDVDSATSAAGYQLSPDRNTCFFGSPQFDPQFESDEMKDLQHVLDNDNDDHEPSSLGSNSRRGSSFKDPTNK